MSLFNPAANPLFVPTGIAFGSVLAGGLAVVSAVNRGRLDRIASSTLFVRWRTWALIAPVFAGAALAGPAVLAALVALASSIALLEFASVAGLPASQRLSMVGAGVAVVCVAAFAPEAIPGVLVGALLVLAFGAISRGRADAFREVALAFLGLAYVSFLLAHAPLMLQSLEEGTGLLLAVGLSVALSDVAAFTFGKAFGRRPLAPALSPNKTWEGAAGNLVGAAVAFAIMHFAIADLSFVTWLLLPPAVAAAALSGDLFESLLKRSFGVKDASDWLSGFGGLLDRIDSLLFALPAAYYIALILG